LAVLDLAESALITAKISFARVDGSVTSEDRSRAILAHQRGEVRVLLGSKVLEHGLNLQHCPVLFSLDSSWNPARERQREGRIRRIGSPWNRVEHVGLLPDTPLARAKDARIDEKLSVARRVGLAAESVGTVSI
jgi:superfamily II DNA or RNA helicase